MTFIGDANDTATILADADDLAPSERRTWIADDNALTFELDPPLGAGHDVVYFANQFLSLEPVLMRSSRPARHGEKAHEI